MGHRAFESDLSSIGDETIYGRKIRARNISIIESAFCGQTFLWNDGLLPNSDRSYTNIDKENTNIIHTTVNENQSPTGSSEVIWIIEAMDETFIHSTSEVICYSFLEDRFDIEIDPVREFQKFGSNLGLPRTYLERDEIPNLTLVSDPPFESLLQFICSQQMSMDRIHKLNNTLKEEFGSETTIGEHTFHSYPTAEKLSTVKEEELRDLSFGYRSEYITNTLEQILQDNPTLPERSTELSQSKLHKRLCEYYGVGDKIADCVQLYGYNDQVIPIDTWTRKLAKALEPNSELSSYKQHQNCLKSHFRTGKEGLDQLFAYELLTSDETFLQDISEYSSNQEK